MYPKTIAETGMGQVMALSQRAADAIHEHSQQMWDNHINEQKMPRAKKQGTIAIIEKNSTFQGRLHILSRLCSPDLYYIRSVRVPTTNSTVEKEFSSIEYFKLLFGSLLSNVILMAKW